MMDDLKFPLVSVIVPNYNHARYLKRRMSSILNQTYSNIEIILLDDCSTDNSRGIIESYRQTPKVSQIVYNDANSGNTFLQWAKGIDLAKGDLVWIAESDDWCELNMLEELVEAYLKRKDIAISYTTSLLVEDNGRPLWPVRNAKTKYFTGVQYVKRYILFDNYIMNASSAVFSREKALSIPRDYQGIKGAGDYFFWTYLAMTGNVVVVNKALNRFVRHAGTVTDSPEMIINNFRKEKKLLDIITSNIKISPFRRFLATTYKKGKANNISESIIQDVCSSLYGSYGLNFVERLIFRVQKSLRVRYQIYI